MKIQFIRQLTFALANTAVLIPADIIGSLRSSVSIGIIAGLVLGKPLGIFLTSKILVALKIAHLPNLANWKQFLGMGTLAGIGFTMSIFTTTLAFHDEAHRDIAKISILLSLVTTLTISWTYFLFINPKASIKHVRPEPVMPPEMAIG